MGMAVTWGLGLLWALVAPRSRGLVLGLCAAVFVTVLTVGLAGWLAWSVWLVALLAAVLTALATVLIERAPRVPLFVLALGALVRLVHLSVGHPSSKLLGALFGLMALGLAIASIRRPRVALRLFCAVEGADLCMAMMGHRHGLTVLLVIILFVANAFLIPRGWKPLRALRNTRAPWFAVAPVLAVLVVPLLASELPAPLDALGTARLGKLANALPQGGYLWPLPSEAITWGEHGKDFPRVDNLDARYLSGTSRVDVFRLPGTSFLLGALFANTPVQNLRSVKEPAELEDMTAAAHATVGALAEALPLLRPGMSERAFAQTLDAAMLHGGCDALSFPTIVAAGSNAAEPHASPTAHLFTEGELVVVDMGCSRHHYASDFTRTLPVGGHFSAAQRPLYQAVLDAQQAALAQCRPGARLQMGKDTLDDRAKAVVKAAAADAVYTHALGHPVGLFVHDVGGMSGPLEAGMVITLEPGLYRKGELGIRLEDTYRVTETGCEALTTGFPAAPQSVETRMRPPPPSPPEPGPGPAPGEDGGVPDAGQPPP